MVEIIKDLTISVTLPKEVLSNLERAGYLDSYIDYSGNTVIRSYRSRSTLNKTIADKIIKEWK